MTNLKEALYYAWLFFIGGYLAGLFAFGTILAVLKWVG